ncbi:hypothetical protein ABFA07_009007 [Porites harrisoni]
MSSYTSLLLELSNSLTTANLQKLKFLCVDVIPTGRLERINRGIELFGALEQLDMLSQENRDFLASKLIAVNRNDLRNKLLGIQDGDERSAHAVCKVTRKNEKELASTETMKIQQEHKEGMQELALVPVTSLQRQSSVTTEPRETTVIQTSNRDSDDDERDCGSNKLKGHSENPRQMQQETIQDMSKQPSTCRGPGDLPGDLVSAVSGYRSFPSKEVTPLDPECSLKAEGNNCVKLAVRLKYKAV